MSKRYSAIYMGKSKLSTISGLEFLLKQNFDIKAVVCPPTTPLETFALANNLPVYDEQTIYEKKWENVDLVISFLFWKKIKPILIKLPKIGCINLHPAPLPDFRGLGGYNIAIMENLKEWGVSAHFVDTELDTGDLIQVNRFPISPEIETAYSLEKRSQKELLSLFEEIILKLKKGESWSRSKQTQGRYISRKNFEELRNISIQDSAEEIHKKIRAFWYPPHHGASIIIDKEEFTLINTQLLEQVARLVEKDKV